MDGGGRNDRLVTDPGPPSHPSVFGMRLRADLVQQEHFIVAAAMEDLDHFDFAGQNAVGDDGDAFEWQYPHALLQIVSCAALHRKFAEGFAVIEDAVYELLGNLRLAGVRSDPVVDILKVLVCSARRRTAKRFTKWSSLESGYGA